MASGRPLPVIALVVLAVAAAACRQGAPLSAKAIRGWAEGEGYQWMEGPDEIRTEQQFFDYIDGAAQPIIDLGWKRSVFGVLRKGEARLRLTVHEMRDPKAALALFEQNRFNGARPIALGERAAYWERGTSMRGILFQRKAFFCELILEKGGTKGDLLGLASSLEHLTD